MLKMLVTPCSSVACSDTNSERVAPFEGKGVDRDIVNFVHEIGTPGPRGPHAWNRGRAASWLRSFVVGLDWRRPHF